jgi:outer membrane protein assembly factor BamB
MLDGLKRALFAEPPEPKPLRLLPGIIVVALQWLLWLVVPAVAPGMDTLALGIFGGLLGGLAIVVWWAFFSRAPGLERWGATILMILGLVVTSLVQHESMAAAQLGLTMFIYAVPILSLAFVIWAVISPRLAAVPRRVTMAATILIACGAWAFVRDEGMTSDIGHDFAWRWAGTVEEQFGAQLDETPVTPPLSATTQKAGADWPGFRGAQRDSVIHGLRIATDWSASPPTELWRRPIGRGFSSFAVRGELIYTQEQRGDDEVVTCYYLQTGTPAWIHRDKARFLGADAHPGPRATPTLSDGRVYTLGATGILNVLDARTGKVVWSRSTTSDVESEAPIWGLASSPVVVGEVVIVHVATSLVAYDRAGGEPRWTCGVGTGYSSPHQLTIGGVVQVVLLSGTGASGFAPADGTMLWEHRWQAEDRILQPAVTPDGDILVGDILKAIRRIAVAHGPEGWTTEERWTSVRLKSNFNDLVLHKDHAYGFSGTSLTCIDIRDGTRPWRGTSYGGQVALLADQDVLLVLSEKGELALVEATPEKFSELTKFPAVEGKTWNHPALAGDILLVRNAREMAAFRLPRARASETAVE